MSTMDGLLRAEGLRRTYVQGSQEVHALRGASLALGAGEIGCVLGRSGSGKSTLLHILGCLERPDEGRVWLRSRELGALADAERVRVRREELGFVFQAMNLVEYLTACENVALPLRYAGIGRDERMERARALMEQVGLESRVGFMPHQLSGGEQQRVAFARAVVGSPALVLADEPTGELDSETAREIEDLIHQMNRAQGSSFLIVTHDETLARIAHHTWLMEDGVLRELPEPEPQRPEWRHSESLGGFSPCEDYPDCCSSWSWR